MEIVLWILAVLGVVFTPIAIFLGKEMLKKFGFINRFIRHSCQEVTYQHLGQDKPSMRNIVLRGQTSFSVLVGFTLDIPILGYSGFDYYGFVRSSSDGIAVISTYMGRGACTFRFFVNTDLNTNPITTSSEEDEQRLRPDATYPPHWWQKLRFYG